MSSRFTAAMGLPKIFCVVALVSHSESFGFAGQALCRKVWRIRLGAGLPRERKIPEPEERRLLVSYGAQLRGADLQGLSIETCREVLAYCSNLHCIWENCTRVTLIFGGRKFWTSYACWLLVFKMTGRDDETRAVRGVVVNLDYLGAPYSCYCDGSELVKSVLSKILGATSKQYLDSLSVTHCAIGHGLMLVVVRSLHRVRALDVLVEEVKCYGMPRLFRACPIVEDSPFS